MVRREIPRTVAYGYDLLGSHHKRVHRPTHEHDKGEYEIHDADFFMINAREPISIQPTPALRIKKEPDDDKRSDNYYQLRAGFNRPVYECVWCEFAKHS